MVHFYEMNEKFLRPFVFTAVLLFSVNSYGQSANKRIEVFTKVWGFLKYHHPAVATGNINWDSVYVNSLPEIEKSVSTIAFNRQILRLINDSGGLERDTPVHLPASLFSLNHNLKWIDEDKLISANVRARLKDIYIFRNQKENRYIKLSNQTPADYSGELQYADMAFPERNYRLLFLARCWNALNYFAPYKYLTRDDWNNVLTRLIPKVISAYDTVTYYKTLLQLANALNDGHAQLYLDNTNSPVSDLVFGRFTAPVYIDIVDGQVVVRKLADTEQPINVQKGDIILGIDAQTTTQRIKALRPYISGSNFAGQNKLMSRVFLNTHLPYQRLKIQRKAKIITIEVKCILTSQRNWGDLDNYIMLPTGYKKIGNAITYISTAMIWDGTIDSIKASIAKSRAVIFDIRNYPNGNSAFYGLVRSMLEEPKVISTSLKMRPDQPGYFYWEPAPALGSSNNSPYKGKVLILVDERTQSQGEYSAMTLQTLPGSVTIGSQTAGGDGMVAFIPIGGKLAISYSGYGVYYPNKGIAQRKGVKIDIPVKKTITGALEGRDEILQKALSYLKLRGIK